jgi:hypothetical protein
MEMWEKLKDHPVFSVIGAIAAIGGLAFSALALTEPEYAKVTDGTVCGYAERTESSQPYQWNACENPNKVTGYRYSERVSKSSGWVSGGKDQNWHCTNVKREKERAVGQSIVWSKQKSSEQPDKDLLGHAKYKYHCAIDAQWGPIYAVERWEGCGEAAAVTKTVADAKTCHDETQRIGWKWKWQ